MTRRNLRPVEQKRLHRDWRRRTRQPLSLVLDSVQTPYNVGSIIRTAAAFDVDTVWLCGATAPPSHPKTRKTSLGTERLVSFAEAATVASAAREARSAGFHVIGLELADDAEPLHVASILAPTCLVVGHEDRGLSSDALAACESVVYVATPGKVGSLNVAVATALALYEVRRREWSDPEGVDLDA